MLPVLYMGIGCALLATVLFACKPETKKSDLIAAFFIIILGCRLISRTVPPNVGEYHVILQIILMLPLLYGPLLLFYAELEADQHYKLSLRKLFHLLPFLVMVIIYISINPAGSAAMKSDASSPGIKNEMKRDVHRRESDGHAGISEKPASESGSMVNYNAAGGVPAEVRRERSPQPKTVLARGSAILFSLIVYSIIIYLRLNHHRRKIDEFYSSHSSRITLSWLKWTVICFTAAYIFVVFVINFAPGIYRHPLLDPRYAPEVALTFFLFAFSVFSLRQKALFDGVAGSSPTNTRIDKPKYEKSGLKENEKDRISKALENYMSDEKPWLDCDITIQNISSSLNIPRHYLAQTLNEKFGRNFYAYINGYRIEEAKRLMAEDPAGDFTVLRIAYDCGFNSKSSFNSVFKKFTGATPSEFRESIKCCA